jgi:hypothetical protein
MNPAPDMDVYSLTPHYFEWVVKHMADMAIRLAKNPRRQERALSWEGLFTGSRLATEVGGAAVLGTGAAPASVSGAGDPGDLPDPVVDANVEMGHS